MPVTQGTEAGATIVEGNGGTMAFTAGGGATTITGTRAGGGGITGTGTSASGLTGGIISVGGVPAGPPVAAADFVEAWATAICDAVEPCCQASQYGWSRSGCEADARDVLKG